MGKARDYEDNPECYGRAENCGRLDRCRACVFAESCAFYCNTAQDGRFSTIGDKGRNHHAVRLDARGERDDAAFSTKESEGEGAEELKPDALEELLRFLLTEMDDATLAYLMMAMRSETRCVYELARLAGRSRQTVHWRLMKAASGNEAIRRMLQAVFFKFARCAKGPVEKRKKMKRGGLPEANVKTGMVQPELQFNQGEMNEKGNNRA